MSNPALLSVCIVTDAYLPSIGGVENHVLHLSVELKRLGHEVVVVTHKLPPMPNRATSQPVMVLPILLP